MVSWTRGPLLQLHHGVCTLCKSIVAAAVARDKLRRGRDHFCVRMRSSTCLRRPAVQCLRTQAPLMAINPRICTSSSFTSFLCLSTSSTPAAPCVVPLADVFPFLPPPPPPLIVAPSLYNFAIAGTSRTFSSSPSEKGTDVPSTAVLRKSRMLSCVMGRVWVGVEVVLDVAETGVDAAESMILMARREVVLSEMPKRRRASAIWYWFEVLVLSYITSPQP
jgi:hypothetical protein